jgi:hypothetical protein
MRSIHVILCAGLTLVGADNVFANDTHDIIAKFSNEERNALFTKYMQKSNEKCDVVVRNFFQGFSGEGTANWSVKCKNKSAYSIGIENDKAGSSKILSCEILKLAKIDCFQTFEEQDVHKRERSIK